MLSFGRNTGRESNVIASAIFSEVQCDRPATVMLNKSLGHVCRGFFHRRRWTFFLSPKNNGSQKNGAGAVSLEKGITRLL
jgi:hypothetical protein